MESRGSACFLFTKHALRLHRRGNCGSGSALHARCTQVCMVCLGADLANRRQLAHARHRHSSRRIGLSRQLLQFISTACMMCSLCWHGGSWAQLLSTRRDSQIRTADGDGFSPNHRLFYRSIARVVRGRSIGNGNRGSTSTVQVQSRLAKQSHRQSVRGI